MAVYFGVIHKVAGSNYSISLPDLPGCASARSGLGDLEAAAREAVSLYLKNRRGQKEALPSPSEYADIYAKHARDEGFFGVILVTVELRAKRVRINISLPEADLRYIDTTARRYGLDRSGFMLFAVKHMMSSTAQDTPKTSLRSEISHC
jgi:predicted RNase H-like HicB family nuclease